MKKIATIYTPFKEKFGIPRQSGLTESEGKIVFEKEYSRREAFNCIETFTHLWIVWEFSENCFKPWSPTVRPPRLGGNRKVGVFASRSPFRPNPIGLSSVRLVKLCFENGRAVLYVKGVDMLDGTPVYDVKPYIPYTDCLVDAKGGFADDFIDYSLNVEYDEKLFLQYDEKIKENIIKVLSFDPRPSYQDDPDRIYGMNYFGHEIKFCVKNNTLKIISID